eukprot:CAMPEP_0171761696 /NCGR_PEP_ID=MMETSP0991-20121206/48220_1 /TAXON_ID=483369 /ORGANISM="non described non described, Strain CCMP2098" /LENGTH=76 /DNA_ID=CAMNT_0012365029 /DNA_START=190 /DNA_END=416 /DNA_ORIENTATION=-
MSSSRKGPSGVGGGGGSNPLRRASATALSWLVGSPDADSMWSSSVSLRCSVVQKRTNPRSRLCFTGHDGTAAAAAA